jgi:hypothetical protein
VSAGAWRDDLGAIINDVMRLTIELMQLQRECLRGSVALPDDLREVVADALESRQPLHQLLAQERTTFAPAPVVPPAPTVPSSPSPDDLIARYGHKVALLRVLFDHAAAGGHWRKKHAATWTAAEMIERGLGGTRFRADVMEPVLEECLAEGLAEYYREGVRITSAGRAWLAKADTDWLATRCGGA